MPEWPEADTEFAADRIEQALDEGTVDARAREELVAALAELAPARARKRREQSKTGTSIVGP